METPDANKVTTSPYCHLVHVRFGKQERAILLAANAETWTAVPNWSWRQPKLKPALTRACGKLERLNRIESRCRQLIASGCHHDADDSNSRPVTRIGRDGYEQHYREYVQAKECKLTPLGAAVVEQFGSSLAADKRIRWARFNPPPEAAPPPPPAPPEPEPEPVKLSPEQEELRHLLGSLHVTGWHQSFLTSQVEQARQAAADLPELEAAFAAMRRSVEAWSQRIAELRAQGVTLPEDQPEADANEGRTDEAIRGLEPPEPPEAAL